MIKDKIIDAYEKLAIEYHANHTVLDSPDAVIRISPEAFHRLMAEDNYLIRTNGGGYYVEMYGVKFPLLITDELPEYVEVAVQLRQDYMRQERMALEEKFIRMWGYDR